MEKTMSADDKKRIWNNFLEKAGDLVFYPVKAGTPAQRQSYLLLFLLYLIGILHWANFYDYGRPRPFAAGDWPQEYYYETVLREMVTSFKIPYYISYPYHYTIRFLAVPEINLSPQILLLRFLPISQFVMINILLLYTLGYLGCLRIKKKYSLSLFSFAIFYFLFNFNGHITTHLSVGHPWGGYFLLPFFLLYLLELAENKNLPFPAIKLSLVLFAILLQGSFHLFNRCLLFLVVTLLFNWQLLNPVLGTLLLTTFLSLFRLLPGMFSLYKIQSVYITGYRSLRDVWDALTLLKMPQNEYIGGILQGYQSWWEYDMYVGVIGLAILLYFGIYLRFKNNSESTTQKFHFLDNPCLTFFILSLSYFYFLILELHIPFLRVERVPSRFILLPVLFFLFISVVRIQEKIAWFTQNRTTTVLSLAGLMQLGFALATHSFYWRVTSIETNIRPNIDFLLHSNVHIVELPSIFYNTCFNVTFLISCFTFLGLCGYIAFFRSAAPKE
jgi:hypothetical protein